MTRINLSLFFGLILLLFSCTKESGDSLDSNVQKEVDHLTQEEVIVYTTEDVNSILVINNSFDFTDNLLDGVFDFYKGVMVSEERDLDCVDIEFEDNFWKTPNVLTLDYGQGCELPNGDILAGVISVSYNKFLNRTGAVRTLTFDGFTINGDAVTGSETTSNLGKNENGHYVVQKTLSGGTITQDGQVALLEYNKSYEFAMSGVAYDFADKNLVLTETVNGTTLEGVVFALTTETPLNLSIECHCVNSGHETIVLNDSETYTVDYGDGTCEAVAVVTMPDNTTESESLCN